MIIMFLQPAAVACEAISFSNGLASVSYSLTARIRLQIDLRKLHARHFNVHGVSAFGASLALKLDSASLKYDAMSRYIVQVSSACTHDNAGLFFGHLL